MSDLLRLKVLKIFLWVMGVFLLFWWPLSHWFYSDFYHQTLMGFQPGSYPDNMVKVIGATGFVPVLLLFFSAMDPIRNRQMVVTLIIFSFLMAGTFLFLVLTGQFPVREWINVSMLAFSGLFLIVCYPWKRKED